jgi:hypothetical protein
VRLQAYDAVGDMDAGVFELLRPRDVRLLVEARFQLDDADDLLAFACCADQRLHDPGLRGGGAVRASA